jgi:hypothetical protein
MVIGMAVVSVFFDVEASFHHPSYHSHLSCHFQNTVNCEVLDGIDPYHFDFGV